MTITVTSPETAERFDRADGRGMQLLLDSAATGGRLSALLCQVPAASSGPPLHVHPDSDETFVVLEGALLLHADGHTTTVDAGGSVFVARGTPHTFATPPDSSARFIAVHSPGGFEEMHREVHAAEHDLGRLLAPEEIVAVAQRHDWRLAGAPLLPSGELAGGAR